MLKLFEKNGMKLIKLRIRIKKKKNKNNSDLP